MTQIVSDEILTAYLDGELDATQRREVEAALQADSALAARLAALELPVDAVKQAFDQILETAPAPPQIPDAPKHMGAGMRMGTGLVAAAVLVLGIGLGAVWAPLANRPLPPDWKMAVANYQVLYVPQTLAKPAPPPDQATAQLAALSATLGRDLSAALSVPGLDYRRAQMLGLEGAPLVQIAYMAPGDVPMAICITTVKEGAYAPRTETLAGLASAHWVADGYGYLVIGGADLAQVETIAADMAGRI